MAVAKRKFYVVWEGRDSGVFDTWEECKQQVDSFAGAKYKAFYSREEALDAFRKDYWDVVKKNTTAAPKAPRKLKKSTEPIPQPLRNAIAVDAACSGNPGRMEYRGVFVNDSRLLFHAGPYEDGTNNIGEFLAIVHGLSYLKKNNLSQPLYSDSRNAILWVKNKQCRTKLAPTSRNAELFQLIARAEKWLHENTYTTTILKWETELWGEIPADFGRK